MSYYSASHPGIELVAPVDTAEQPDGRWTQIAANLPNDGRYVWTMPVSGVPYKFYVRVEAVDKAGNRDPNPASASITII